MSFLDPYIGAIKGIALMAVVAGLLWTGHHFGAQGVQAKWSAAELLRANSEKAAVLERDKQNAADAAKQKADNQQITKAKDEEIDKLRNDLARAPRMRIGTALCGRPAGTAKTASASGSDGTDPAGRVLSAEMDGAVKSLILEMEQAAATGRACQAFVTSNGMGL